MNNKISKQDFSVRVTNLWRNYLLPQSPVYTHMLGDLSIPFNSIDIIMWEYLNER